MKKALLIFVFIIILSCERKVDYYSLRNDAERYYMENSPYTGEALDDTQSEFPSTVYEFEDGWKIKETEYFSNDIPGRKVRLEKQSSLGRLQSEKEFSSDGLLLREEYYSWDMTKKSASVLITWYDWCGKAKRKKALVCDENFSVKSINYDRVLPQPCN